MLSKECCDEILLDRQPSYGQMAWEVICTDVANKKRQESKNKAMGVKIGCRDCEIQMRDGMV